MTKLHATSSQRLTYSYMINRGHIKKGRPISAVVPSGLTLHCVTKNEECTG